MGTDHSTGDSHRDETLTVLLISTRDLRGQLTGRKAVLRTTVDSLVRLGHRVVIAHFGDAERGSVSDTPSKCDQVRYFRIHGPRFWELMIQIGLDFLSGRKSLNECLYTSRRARADLGKIAHAEKVDIVITDMVRTAAYGELLGRPWIADLDDLLSLRYRRIATERRSQDGLLGYHKAPALRILSWLFRPALSTILRNEAAIIARREIAIARHADLTLTVSSSEAKILASISSRSISTTPFSVRGPSQVASLKERSRDLVFLGGFTYQPNRDAVYTFDSQILGQLRSSGLDDVCLYVIGGGGEGIDRQFSSSIRFVGYVDDLDAELQNYKAMLVPELLQGGIKTKIVHAALNGVIVLAHDTAIAGMGMKPDVDVLTWRSPQDLAALLRRVRSNDDGLSVIAENARCWALSNFGEEKAEAMWRTYLSSLAGAFAEASAGPEDMLVGEANSHSSSRPLGNTSLIRSLN